MRIMRKDAAGEAELQQALELLGAAGDVLESNGWTALPPIGLASGESEGSSGGEAAAGALSDA